MGFFDRFKKNKSNKNFSKDSNNTIMDDSNNLDSENTANYRDNESSSSKSSDLIVEASNDINSNFKYLDDLIHSGKNEIILNSDIVLDDDEWLDYTNGINLDVDNLVIDGNGFKISSINEARIFRVTGNDIVLKNLTIIEGNSFEGGAIFNEGNLLIKDCYFNDNFARDGSTIFNQTHAKLKCIGCNFSENHSSNFGGVIYNNIGSSLEIVDCNFDKNFADEKDSGLKHNQSKSEHHYSGGVIFNRGDVEIIKSNFLNNSAVEGGVIYNQDSLEIYDSNFFSNESFDGSVIFNVGKIKLKKSHFENNIANGIGTINNTESADKRINSELIISNCIFKNNSAYHGSGIINFSKVVLKNTEFNSNFDRERGVITNQNGASFDVFKCNFYQNSIESNYGGIVYNLGSLFLDEGCFKENCSKSKANDIFNGNFIKIENSKFLKSENNTLFNKGKMEIFKSNFKDIDSKYMIWNDNNANLVISIANFTNNSLEEGIIYNIGESCNISEIIFQDNNYPDFCNVVYNDSNMILENLNFKDSLDFKPILNKGYLEVRKFKDDEIELMIENQGKLENFSFDSNSNKFTFSHLNDLILKGDKEISLKDNITLDNYEVDFFMGGIELDVDEMIIEGNDKFIDCRGKSRIFNVTGKNIIIKNLTLLNGNLTNDFDSHSNGGGAIRIVKDASLTLENCRFCDNCSNDDGGSILNNGILNSKKSLFKNNNSNNYGGVVYNRGDFNSDNDTFENNVSKLAPAIYNYGNLDLKNPIFLKNALDIDEEIHNQFIFSTDNLPIEPIFNNGNLFSDKNYLQFIYNIGSINKENSNESLSFIDLNKFINNSNEIKLNYDVVFDYMRDSEYIDGIDVDKNGLVIDGSNHYIDANNSASFFNIHASEIIFKNIIFINAFSYNHEIFNIQGKIRFENCIFKNNTVLNDFSLINNNNDACFVNCIFSNNSSNESSIIANFSRLTINNSKFINNFSHKNSIFFNGESSELNIVYSRFMYNFSSNQSSIINNYAKTCLKNSVLFNNSSNMDGGVVYNYGILDVASCDFLFNNGISGGVIYNSGVTNLNKSNFCNNFSEEGGGALYNFEKFNIDSCQFIKNRAKIGSVIYNRGDIKIFNSMLAHNFDSIYAAILIQIDASIDERDCTFLNNFPKDILNLNNVKL